MDCQLCFNARRSESEAEDPSPRAVRNFLRGDVRRRWFARAGQGRRRGVRLVLNTLARRTGAGTVLLLIVTVGVVALRRLLATHAKVEDGEQAKYAGGARRVLPMAREAVHGL